MRIGILGSGGVGRVLSDALSRGDHDVMLGTRDVGALMARGADRGEPFADWHEANPAVLVGTFAEAAEHGEVVVNATAGAASLAAVEMAGVERFAGKILIDVANPLDSQGMPPSLTVVNTDSLGEQLQRRLTDTRVVKTLNTVTAVVMVNPAQVNDGEHHLFVCGNDADAKSTVAGWLRSWFGWRHIMDLGDITAARGMEMYLPLWVLMMGTVGTPVFNVSVVR